MAAVIAYLTDVEGRWDKLETFVAGNQHVSLHGDVLVLADGITFVFGGDAIDRGPAGRKIVRTLLAAKRTYDSRVILLAGNRDINKLRLVKELSVPDRGEKLKWILEKTMGAPKAFAHRATEIGTSDPDAVAASYLADLAPGGDLRAFLEAAQLAYRNGATLFVHGGVTSENFHGDVDRWIAELDRFYRAELAEFAAGRSPDKLIAYQAPVPGTHLNQGSVVYARPTDEHGNPELPDASVIANLRASGITRVVVGHTPSGDCPALVRDGEFELVLGDNSYGRIEEGSQLAFTDATTSVHGVTRLDDGSLVRVGFQIAHGEVSPVGRRDGATGQLVKAATATGFILFRGLANHEVQQVTATDLAARTLVPASGHVDK